MAFPDLTQATGLQGVALNASGTHDSLHTSVIDMYEKYGYLPTMFDRYRDEFNPMDWLEMTGKYEMTNRPEFTYFEYSYPRIAQRISAKSATAPVVIGGQFDVTLVRNSETKVQVRVKDIITAPNGGQAYVSAVAVGATTVATLIPFTDTSLNELYNSLVVGSYISVTGNAVAEESEGDREAILHKPLGFKGSIQTFRETYKVTGDAQTFSLQFPTIDANGKITTVTHHFLREAEVTYQEFRKQIGMTLFLQRAKNPSINISDGGYNVPFTTGLVDLIRQHGINYAKPNQWTIADFVNIDRSLDRQKAPNEMTIFAGNKIHYEISSGVTIEMQNTGGILYNSFGNADNAGESGKERAAHVGFNSFSAHGGRTYHLKKCALFNDPQKTDLPGMKYTEMAMMLPSDQVRNGDGVLVESLKLMYREQKMLQGTSQSRKWRQAYIDEFTQNKSKDKQRMEYFAEVGLQANGLNRAVLIER